VRSAAVRTRARVHKHTHDLRACPPPPPPPPSPIPPPPLHARIRVGALAWGANRPRARFQGDVCGLPFPSLEVPRLVLTRCYTCPNTLLYVLGQCVPRPLSVVAPETLAGRRPAAVWRHAPPALPSKERAGPAGPGCEPGPPGQAAAAGPCGPAGTTPPRVGGVP
jgi:hypothetical protein